MRAKRKQRKHGAEKADPGLPLEEAMVLLIQNQASFVQNQTAFLGCLSEVDRRLSRIEALLLDHSRILSDMLRMIEAMPETIREKIGFRPSDEARSPSFNLQAC